MHPTVDDDKRRHPVKIEPASYSFLNVEVRDRIVFIEMNRPERMNACDAEEHEEFPRILRDIAGDPDVLVAVLHGAGRAFSVGATYEWMEDLTRDRELLLARASECAAKA